MKRFQIWFWHGYDRKLAEKLDDFCDKVADTYFYSGTLDSFAEQFEGKFIYYPETDKQQAMLAITQHSNFGQR